MIESVPKATWNAAWSEYLVVTILILLVAVVSFLLHPIIPVFILIVYIGALYQKTDTRFLKEFALVHNLSYEKTTDLESTYGRLFKRGDSRHLSHVLSGTHDNHPLRLFRYSYSTGSGKHRQTHRFTVFEISFAKTLFPYILLQSRSMGKYSSSDVFGYVRDEKLPLENNFGDYFKLFATKGYEIEVFEIFTPKILEYLIHNAKDFSIEFAENKIYVYDDKPIANREGLTKMLAVVQKLLETVGPLLNRMHDDFEALHPYYNNEKK